jgi:PAS domain S-box-containing protein
MLQVDHSPDEAQQLRRSMRDVVALSTLPAIWLNHDPRQIAESTAEVLVAMLGLEFAYVSLQEKLDGCRIEVARTHRRRAPDHSSVIRAALAGWLKPPRPDRPIQTENPLGPDSVRIAFLPVGFTGDAVIAAASKEPDFPNKTQRLLMTVAANQMAMALQRRHAEDAQRRSEALNRRILESSGDRIDILDRNGRLLSMNARGLSIIEIANVDQLRGRPWSALWPENVRSASEAALATARAGDVGRFTALCPSQKGAPRWLDVNVAPVVDEHGRGRHFVSISREITEIKRTEEELAEEKSRLETLNGTGAALAAELDLERLVKTIIEAGIKLSGAQSGAFLYDRREEHGERFELYTLAGAQSDAFVESPVLRNVALFTPTFWGGGIIRSNDIARDPRYGRNAPQEGPSLGHLPVRSFLAVPVVSRLGEVLGGLFFGHEQPSVFTDRTESLLTGIASQAAISIDNAELYQAATREIERRKEAERAVRLGSERLRAALEASDTGTFRWDLHANIVEFDESLIRLLGLSSDETVRSLGQFLALVHPEDRARVAERCRQCISEGVDFEMEYRIVRPDHSIRWLYDRGKVFREEGVAVYMTGACVDITKSKWTEEALRQSEARFRDLVDARGGLPPVRLRRVLDHVENYLDGDTSLDTLARLARLSPNHFSELFKHSTGQSPHQYVLRRRISRAQELLAENQLSLADIAYTLGFPSQAHFTTTFRRLVGTTPGAYRQAPHSSNRSSR